MSHTTRRRFSFILALVGGFALVASAPATANAGDRSFRHHGGHHGRQARHHGGHRGHHGRQYRHHGGHYSFPGLSFGHRSYGHHSYGYRRYGHHAYAVSAYYCEPCHHYYDSWDALHHHVNQHHHLAVDLIPALLIHTLFGWVYYG